ncbi:MAG: hypothetical protein LIP28_04000 [Deltaproteobacteria bacterium]|nr:hypothetical protein [Deltaproteobacteria bacterium]
MVDVLRAELSAGRIPRDFTFQSGFGSVGNAVLGNLSSSEFGTLNMYTEVAQDAALSLVLEGRIRAVSATSLLLSAKGRNCLYENLPCLRKRVVLRPQDVTNDAGMIHRMGVIAMNTALEVDIYGNVNSTHVMGSGMMNGIGGSGDFARNSALAVFITPSVAKEGTISSIVPMVSHVDHTEHDVHIVVTEQGVADLRGKSPTERARLIIENCAHPDYRAALRDYCEQANRDASARHTPHSLDKALSWHQRYLDKKHMLL